MSAATKMRALVERVRNRAEKDYGGSFGYGICPADAYVRRAIDELGADGIKSMSASGKFDATVAIKEASGQLTHCNSAMRIEDGGTCRIEKTASPGSFRDFMPEGMQPPPNTLMLLRYTISAPIRDRDRDVLRAEGGIADPKAPLLWQHMGMALIGKTVATIQQPMDKSRLKLPLQKYLDTVDLSRDSIKVVSALLDLQQPLTEDIAKMFEADALRFSHGFQAVEWEEIKSSRGNSPDGFDVKEWHRLEDSAVSIPSCTSAVLELFSRQKFHSDPIKRWAKSMHDSRPVQVRGFCLKHNVLPSVAARIPEQVIGVLEDAAEQPPIRWAKSMPECFDRLPRMEGDKSFDPAGEKLDAATTTYDWVSKYLEVPVKEICQCSQIVASARIGSWLTALKAKLENDQAQINDTRNIELDKERPPVYETIQLTSKASDTFLIEGQQFLQFPGYKAIVALQPIWCGLSVTFFTSLRQRDTNKAFFDDVTKRAGEFRFLKGEAFSISGDFIERSGETWEDVFLTPKNTTVLKHLASSIAEKGGKAPNRGLMAIGPPGSGKTLSTRVLASECKDATFIWVSARDFWNLGAIGGMAYAFDMAKELAPTILCFEDIDGWLSDTAIDMLKTEMDGIAKSCGVTTVLTSNHPENMPKALIDRPGRFHDVLLFDNPTEAVREKMIGRWLPDADDKQRAAAVKRTDGWSGAHVYELCAYAKATAEQDKLDTGEALVKSLDKIAEQRQLIDEVQGRRTRYEPTVWERAVTDRWLKAKADEPEPEAEEEETEETEPDESAPMRVCDECGHEMPAPDGYDSENPPKCPECETGTMMPTPDEEAEEEAEPEEDKSGEVVACLPGSATVSGPLANASTSRWYEGEVVELGIAGNKNLTVTPNHPVLTDHGFVAAGLLNEGDQIVCASIAPGVEPCNPQDYQVPSAIEDVAASIGKSDCLIPKRVAVSNKDFHGDRGNSDVCVIRTDRKVRDNRKSARDQSIANVGLLNRVPLGMGFPVLCQRPFYPGIERDRTPKISLFETLNSLLSLIVRQRTPILCPGFAATTELNASLFEIPNNTCFAESQVSGDRGGRLTRLVSSRDIGGVSDLSAAANQNAGLLQPVHNRSTRNAVTFCQSLGRYASVVRLCKFIARKRLKKVQWPTVSDILGLLSGARNDAKPTQSGNDSCVGNCVSLGKGLRGFSIGVSVNKLLTIRRIPFAGHVYNLSTDVGYYIAEGVIVHNCDGLLQAANGEDSQETLPTKPEAEERLAQIERFGGKGGEPDGTKADDEPPADNPADEPKPDEEEPAAKKLVCEDCGYSMPMDKAEANEDGGYECPECGGKMNPAGEKDVTDPEQEKRAACLWRKCTKPGVSVAVEHQPFGKSGSTILTTTIINVAGKAEEKTKTASRCFDAAEGFFDRLYRKAGRVLSQRNMDGLVEAAADLEEAMDVDKVPRKCAALLERAHKRLVTVIDSAQPAAVGDEARPDARPKEPTGKSAEKTLGQFLATAEANELSTIQEIIAARLDVIHRDARADALKSRGLI